MKALMLLFDSLNRHMLSPYGCEDVDTPNFKRLAARSCTYDHAYVGSMPCMPARRDLHTGRYNFLHRSWGPLEPFDDSMPALLKANGVPSCLISDHYHYWEEGGATYHTKYSNWEFLRGQEGDPWICDLIDPKDPPRPNTDITRKPQDWLRQDWINRAHGRNEADFPQAPTVTRGLEFLKRNHGADRWFLQLETFDPHEPYYVPQKYLEQYGVDLDRYNVDWPDYVEVPSERREVSEHFRKLNAALISFCDAQLGRVLDAMDQHSLWEDTLLIVSTDHGFLLGEHDWWGKCRMPFYSEIARIPLFIWDPRCRKAGQRRSGLAQWTDLSATLLEYFDVERPPDMTGFPLKDSVARDERPRSSALFGMFGGQVNVTDGRYVYLRGPSSEENTPLYEHTLMPTHMRGSFAPGEFQDMELAPPFSFTKGCRLMRMPGRPKHGLSEAICGTWLFDVEQDPGQRHPLHDEAIERRMIDLMREQMKLHDAPADQYERLGLAD